LFVLKDLRAPIEEAEEWLERSSPFKGRGFLGCRRRENFSLGYERHAQNPIFIFDP
jgi:hypothetical protein